MGLRPLSVFAAVALLFAVAIFTNLPTPKASAQAARPAAFTIYYEEEQESYGPNGTTVASRTGQYGRSSDGSFYEKGDDILSIAYDAQTRKLQSFDVSTGRVSTFVLNFQEAVAFSSLPRYECCQPPGPYRYSAGEAVLNIRADKFTTAAGSTELTVWLAPDYGCLFLREENLVRQNGRIISRRVRRATAVVPGEPNRGLFRAPEGLTEVPPSELEFARFQSRYGAYTPIPESLRRTGEAKDARYSAGKSRPR